MHKQHHLSLPVHDIPRPTPTPIVFCLAFNSLAHLLGLSHSPTDVLTRNLHLCKSPPFARTYPHWQFDEPLPHLPVLPLYPHHPSYCSGHKITDAIPGDTPKEAGYMIECPARQSKCSLDGCARGNCSAATGPPSTRQLSMPLPTPEAPLGKCFTW